MGKPKSSSSSTTTSWSALFGLGCFSSSHAADRSGSGSGCGSSKNAAKVAFSSSRPPASAPVPSPEDLSLSLVGSDVLAFTVEEIRVATQDFSASNFVGEGGFGPVYKGRVDERVRPGLRQPQAVAVKLLDLEGTQGHKEWMAEVIFLGQLRHPHLVKLIGYCYKDEHRLLVYEFMARGSLEKHLFKKYSASLPWSTRLKIAIGAAKGLAFLHEAAKPVIYRDFKTSNILLDSDYTAKLSDFGGAGRRRDARVDAGDGHAGVRGAGVRHDGAPDDQERRVQLRRGAPGAADGAQGAGQETAAAGAEPRGVGAPVPARRAPAGASHGPAAARRRRRPPRAHPGCPQGRGGGAPVPQCEPQVPAPDVGCGRGAGVAARSRRCRCRAICAYGAAAEQMTA